MAEMKVVAMMPVSSVEKTEVVSLVQTMEVVSLGQTTEVVSSARKKAVENSAAERMALTRVNSRLIPGQDYLKDLRMRLPR